MIYKNTNGLQSRLSWNDKLDKGREVINELEADLVAFNKHWLNLNHKANKNGFRQMFNGEETDLRVIAAHNVHENVAKVQEGGTAMMVFGELIEQYDSKGSGKDETGLGRWTFMQFEGSDGVKTIVVCGYQLNKNNKTDLGTSFQQHRHYFIDKEKDYTCPRV